MIAKLHYPEDPSSPEVDFSPPRNRQLEGDQSRPSLCAARSASLATQSWKSLIELLCLDKTRRIETYGVLSNCVFLNVRLTELQFHIPREIFPSIWTHLAARHGCLPECDPRLILATRPRTIVCIAATFFRNRDLYPSFQCTPDRQLPDPVHGRFRCVRGSQWGF